LFVRQTLNGRLVVGMSGPEQQRRVRSEQFPERQRIGGQRNDGVEGSSGQLFDGTTIVPVHAVDIEPAARFAGIVQESDIVALLGQRCRQMASGRLHAAHRLPQRGADMVVPINHVGDADAHYDVPKATMSRNHRLRDEGFAI
jgi:hypothetical protein